jgi:hypothetical protein
VGLPDRLWRNHHQHPGNDLLQLHDPGRPLQRRHARPLLPRRDRDGVVRRHRRLERDPGDRLRHHRSGFRQARLHRHVDGQAERPRVAESARAVYRHARQVQQGPDGHVDVRVPRHAGRRHAAHVAARRGGGIARLQGPQRPARERHRVLLHRVRRGHAVHVRRAGGDTQRASLRRHRGLREVGAQHGLDDPDAARDGPERDPRGRQRRLGARDQEGRRFSRFPRRPDVPAASPWRWAGRTR